MPPLVIISISEDGILEKYIRMYIFAMPKKINALQYHVKKHHPTLEMDTFKVNIMMLEQVFFDDVSGDVVNELLMPKAVLVDEIFATNPICVDFSAN